MDSRRFFLLTLLPPLPALGEPLPITLSEALARLRQQGGRDLETLADAVEAEAKLRDALEEWVLSSPGSRAVPAGLPLPLTAAFDEEQVAAVGEEAWVEAVWRGYLDFVGRAGREIGSRLLTRWAARETALRLSLARSRGPRGGEKPDAVPGEGREETFDLAAVLAAWDSTRERGRAGTGLAAAMEAEQVIERARLDFLEVEDPRYSFSVDELAAYLLKLRLLERQRRLDPEKGRSLLRAAVAP